MTKLEELEDNIKSLSRKRDLSIVEANKNQEEINNLTEEYFELSPEFVKVECPTCGGEGFMQVDDKKKKCQNPYIPALGCNGNGYIWMKVWK